MLRAATPAGVCALGAAAPDGRCKTFDAAADGYGRGDAFVAVLLAPTGASSGPSTSSSALPPPRALLAGSAVGQDGRSSALTAPSGPAQTAVVRGRGARRGREWGSAIGVSFFFLLLLFLLDFFSASSSLVVAAVSLHGTGTALGDPLELGALRAALLALRRATRKSSSTRTTRAGRRRLPPLLQGRARAHRGRRGPLGPAGCAGLAVPARDGPDEAPAEPEPLRGVGLGGVALARGGEKESGGGGSAAAAAAAAAAAGAVEALGAARRRAPRLRAPSCPSLFLLLLFSLAGASSFGMSGVNAHALVLACGKEEAEATGSPESEGKRGPRPRRRRQPYAGARCWFGPARHAALASFAAASPSFFSFFSAAPLSRASP